MSMTSCWSLDKIGGRYESMSAPIGVFFRLDHYLVRKRLHICVQGSPMDCTAMDPTISPGQTAAKAMLRSMSSNVLAAMSRETPYETRRDTRKKSSTARRRPDFGGVRRCPRVAPTRRGLRRR